MKKSLICFLVFSITASLVASLLAGCSKSSSKSPNPRSIVIGCDTEPTILNPFLPDGTSIATKLVTSNILWGLLAVTPDLQYTPHIAEQVPTLDNGLVTKDPFTVTYDIKKNAIWSDGTPITSADVKFTWEIIMNGNYPIADRSGYDKIERIDTPYEKTVRLVFREPYAAYRNLFSTAYPILPKHILEGKRFTEAMNDFLTFASGPYKFKEWDRGKQLVIVRNETFWEGKPRIGMVTFKFIPKRNVRLAALENGEIDVGYSPTDEEAPASLKEIKDKKADIRPGLIWEHIGFNLSKPPLNDINVRRAIAFVVDRNKVALTAIGKAEVLNSVLVPEQKQFYTPAWNRYSNDARKSADYLTAAGYQKGSDGFYEKGGKPLVITISTTAGNPTREKIEKIIKDDLARAGIRTEIKNTDDDNFFNHWLPEGNFELGVWAWLESPEPNLDHLFVSDKIPPAGQNYYRYHNPDIDSLLNSAVTTIDTSGRANLYHQIQEKISSDLVVIPLYQHPQVIIYDKRIGGVANNATYEGPFWNLSKWWAAKE